MNALLRACDRLIAHPNATEEDRGILLAFRRGITHPPSKAHPFHTKAIILMRVELVLDFRGDFP